MGIEVNSQESESLDELEYLRDRPDEDVILSDAEANVSSDSNTFNVICARFEVSAKICSDCGCVHV